MNTVAWSGDILPQMMRILWNSPTSKYNVTIPNKRLARRNYLIGSLIQSQPENQKWFNRVLEGFLQAAFVTRPLFFQLGIKIM